MTIPVLDLMVAAPRRSCKDNLQTAALVFCRRAAPFKGISIFNAAGEEGVARSAEAKTRRENKFTLQSFYHLSSIEPLLYVPRIASEKLLYIAAERDPVTGTLAEQRAVLESAKQGGEFAIVKPDPLATYFGQPLEEATAVQIDFLKRKL